MIIKYHHNERGNKKVMSKYDRLARYLEDALNNSPQKQIKVSKDNELVKLLIPANAKETATTERDIIRRAMDNTKYKDRYRTHFKKGDKEVLVYLLEVGVEREPERVPEVRSTPHITEENEQGKLSQTIEESVPSEEIGKRIESSLEVLEHIELLERDIEEILATHPEIIEKGLILRSRQTTLQNTRFDLVFTDSIERTMLVELKRGIVKSTAVTQIGTYVNRLTDVERGRIRPMLIGYMLPNIIKSSCDAFGIDYKEISEKELKGVLRNDQNLLKKIMSIRQV